MTAPDEVHGDSIRLRWRSIVLVLRLEGNVWKVVRVMRGRRAPLAEAGR